MQVRTKDEKYEWMEFRNSTQPLYVCTYVCMYVPMKGGLLQLLRQVDYSGV